MALKYQHSILLLDDEKSITNALTRLFHRERYRILTATSGDEALELMKKQERPFSLIISDQRMPGMNGARFLEEARKISPNTIRFLLTGYSDIDALVDAVNKGEIHRYLSKPWNDSDLLIQVRQSLEQYEISVENRRLTALTKHQNQQLKDLNSQLERKVEERTREVTQKNEELSRMNKELESNLYNTVRAFSSLAEMHTPVLAGHGRRVGLLSSELARFMGLPENELLHVEIAGLLHDIGKIGLPQKLLDYKEDGLNQEEQEMCRRHAEEGQTIVRFISQLDHVGLLIRSHHERMDGQGYPDGLKEDVIPLGSKIIAVTDAYDRTVHMNGGAIKGGMNNPLKAEKGGRDPATEDEELRQAAMHHLQSHAFTCYDPDVVKAFLGLLKTRGIHYRARREVSADELERGMELSVPIYTARGRFLLPAKTVLTDELIRKLKLAIRDDPLPEKIWVTEA